MITDRWKNKQIRDNNYYPMAIIISISLVSQHAGIHSDLKPAKQQLKKRKRKRGKRRKKRRDEGSNEGGASNIRLKLVTTSSDFQEPTSWRPRVTLAERLVLPLPPVLTIKASFYYQNIPRILGSQICSAIQAKGLGLMRSPSNTRKPWKSSTNGFRPGEQKGGRGKMRRDETDDSKKRGSRIDTSRPVHASRIAFSFLLSQPIKRNDPL